MICFVFFKQKTAYEMRISDWSSDVCLPIWAVSIARHQNPDGTWNGAGVFAEITGLSQAEVQWTFDRLKHLMIVERRPRSEAKSIVSREAKGRPWEANNRSEEHTSELQSLMRISYAVFCLKKKKKEKQKTR